MTVKDDLEHGLFMPEAAPEADFFGPARLFDRLDTYKRQGIRAMRLEIGSRAADMGCGAGDDAAEIARLVGPQGTALGVDLSEAMIAKAEERFAGTANLEFLVAEAGRLPLADATLDAVRADRLLIHLADPEAAIGEMVRVLRPGGRIVLSEPDMPGLWVSSGDRETSAAFSRAVAESCRHAHLPRDMGVMLRDMGLTEVEQWGTAMVSDDFSAVGRLVRFETVVDDLRTEGTLPADRIDDWWNDQLERNVAGRFCAGLTVMTVSATKP